MSLLQSVSQHFCGCLVQMACALLGTAGCPVAVSQVPLALGGGPSSLGSRGPCPCSAPCTWQDLKTADSQQTPISTSLCTATSECRPWTSVSSTGWQLGWVVPTVGNKIPSREMPPAKSHLISAPEQSHGMLVVIAFSGREQL